MFAEDIIPTLHDSAHRAASLNFQMGNDVPGQASLFQHLGTAAPRAALTGIIWTSDTMPSDMSRNCTGRSFHRHATEGPL